MNKIIISCITRSNESPGVRYFTRINGVLKIYENTAGLLQEKAQLVSFDWDNLILWLCQEEEEMPLDIIDMEQVAKQLLGKKKVNGLNPPWSIWEILSPFYEENENDDFIKTQRVYYGLEEADETEKLRLYDRFLIALQLCYDGQMIELKEKDEYDRFYNVERPIRIINLERTYRGIAIDSENVGDWVNSLSQQVYRLRNKLQLTYGIIAAQDRGTIYGKLEEKGLLADAWEVIAEKGYYFFLKESKLRDELLELLYEEKKQTTDLNILLSIGALRPKHQQIHPVFDSFGTITARTKMISPNIQHLTKKYRSIVTAHKNKVLRYIDYVQFEAGILANDSGDEVLIQQYNESDVYTEIGKKIKIEKYIAEKEDQRKFCKSLFYKYSYGMDIKNHIGILKDYKLECHKTELSPAIANAFGEYKTLNEFREQVKHEALNANAIGTHQGNFRYLLENEKNVSWAMSQRIQGTASLILKKAIITLRKIDPEIEFLIPMHDAALFQVPAAKKEEKEVLIQKTFEEAFAEECPSIKPHAKFKGFTE